MEDLRVGGDDTTHGEGHLHVVWLLLSLSNCAGRPLNHVLQLLVAQLEGHRLALVEVLVLNVLHLQADGHVDQDLTSALLEEFHLGFAEIEDIFIIKLISLCSLLFFFLLVIFWGLRRSHRLRLTSLLLILHFFDRQELLLRNLAILNCLTSV